MPVFPHGILGLCALVDEDIPATVKDDEPNIFDMIVTWCGSPGVMWDISTCQGLECLCMMPMANIIM